MGDGFGNKGIGTGDQAVAGGAKLVHINLATGKVVNSYVFKAPTLQPTSYLDDVRFNGDFAYITDPGAVGLVVLNLKSGKSWRVLDNHPSIDHQPIYADGKKLILRDGREKRVGLDQLEVSPDGKWLYYQAIPGPLARIETRYLNDSALSAAEVAKHAEKCAKPGAPAEQPLMPKAIFMRRISIPAALNASRLMAK
ncbi:major royal jelly family protein (plasmid) [Pseudomonas silvicola]|nr:major royal jelly family protein [Pseudomonas silvicola]